MTPLALRRTRRPDEGIAMIMVIAMCTIVFMFVGAMFTAVLNTQLKTRYEGDITTAQTAAEAGINDWVYQLNQRDQATGQLNWTRLPALYTQASPSPWTSIGKQEYSGYFKSTGNPTQLEIWMTGRYPIGPRGDTRTIKVIVAREAPQAFSFSMFASKGIDIHHHGSSPLSPQIVTNGVHSNGYINIDYSAEFTANTVEAVGALTFQKGGSIWSPVNADASGNYYWVDQLTNTCYPGGTAPPCTARYSPNATISGVVRANSVTMGNKGQVLPVPANVKTETNIPVTGDGTVYAATANLNGTSYSAPGTYQNATSSPACAQCGKGAAATAGQIGGSLVLAANYAPAVVPFPTLDYSVYRNRPTTEPEVGGAAAHVFASSSAFLSFITDKNNGFYKMVNPDGTLRAWTAADGAPNVIQLDGTYDITSGNLALDWGTMKSMANAATGKSGPAPLLVIRGSLLAEAGNIDLSTGLVMVGKNNRLDFLKWQGTAPNNWPNGVDTSKLLDPGAYEPGVLAAGGTIDAHDYDTDSDWTDITKYEPMKATPIYIRGLVYAAKYDAVNKVSVPQNMHWHNYDPKNITKIYGAQVGGQLHDCNSFSFTYDPIVQAAFGFGNAGKAHIIDYQEIGR